MKDRRDEEDFRNTQGMLSEFSQWEKEGKSELYYFDESGFSQRSSLPCAWSPIGNPLEVPAYSHSRRLNVLGFLSQQGKLFYHSTTERVTAEVVIEAFNQFIEQKDPESFIVIVLDNASMHRSKKFKKARYDWIDKRVYVVYLSSYSPELNLIEILWKKVKHEWLPLTAYLSFDALCESVHGILRSYGDKYRINFA